MRVIFCLFQLLKPEKFSRVSLKSGESFRMEKYRIIRRAPDLEKLSDLCIERAYMFDPSDITEGNLDGL